MISIAMATYNGAEFIREQIDSILAQSYQDYELIVCDDCSTDETFSILKDYEKKDPRIKAYKNESNLGFKKNFEKAIGLTHGYLIALCDQDDIWHPDHLRILMDNFHGNMISAGNSELVDGNGAKIGLSLKELEAFESMPIDEMSKALSFLLFRNPVQGAAMLIKREFLSKALPIPEGVKYHDAWFSVFSCFYGGLSYTNKIVNSYRMHEHNVTGHRVVPKSRFRYFIRSIIHDLSYDREEMIRAILESGIHLDETQLRTLKTCERIINRNKSFAGRSINALFRLKHFNTIYTV